MVDVDVSNKEELRKRVEKQIELLAMPIDEEIEKEVLKPVPGRKGWYEVTINPKSLPEFVSAQIQAVEAKGDKTLVKIRSQKRAQKMQEKILKAKSKS